MVEELLVEALDPPRYDVAVRPLQRAPDVLALEIRYRRVRLEQGVFEEMPESLVPSCEHETVICHHFPIPPICSNRIISKFSQVIL